MIEKTRRQEMDKTTDTEGDKREMYMSVCHRALKEKDVLLATCTAYLDLRGVEVHGDNVVGASHSQHVGY